jgi:hypothetical protein
MGGTTQIREKTKLKTDRARFQRVIARLQAEGFYYANACCQSCGFAVADDAGAEDVVNINDQSIGRAFYGDAGRIPARRLPATMVMPLYVAYSGRAQRILEVFREEGFDVEWDGDWAKTICVRPELKSRTAPPPSQALVERAIKAVGYATAECAALAIPSEIKLVHALRNELDRCSEMLERTIERLENEVLTTGRA